MKSRQYQRLQTCLKVFQVVYFSVFHMHTIVALPLRKAAALLGFFVFSLVEELRQWKMQKHWEVLVLQ